MQYSCEYLARNRSISQYSCKEHIILARNKSLLQELGRNKFVGQEKFYLCNKSVLFEDFLRDFQPIFQNVATKVFCIAIGTQKRKFQSFKMCLDLMKGPLKSTKIKNIQQRKNDHCLLYL